VTSQARQAEVTFGYFVAQDVIWHPLHLQTLRFCNFRLDEGLQCG
jgi:hypothetical protein